MRKKNKTKQSKKEKETGESCYVIYGVRVCRDRNPRCLKYLFTARQLSRWPCWPNIKARPAPGKQNIKQTSTGLAFNRSLEKGDKYVIQKIAPRRCIKVRQKSNMK